MAANPRRLLPLGWVRFVGLTCVAPWVLSLGLATASEGDDGEAKRILFLGDSLTIGYGLTTEEAYPALIQERLQKAGLPYTVTNGGVSGDTTAGGLSRLGWLLKRPVDILVIALGGNDGLRGIDPAATQQNLQAIVDLARKKNKEIKLIIAGMEMPENMGEDYMKRFKAVFPTIAQANKISFIPFLLEGVAGSENLNQPDRIHPNGEGQEVLAETVWKALRPHLK